MKGKGGRDLPIAANRLPGETTSFSDGELDAESEDDLRVRNAFLASEFTRLCAPDVFDPAAELELMRNRLPEEGKRFFSTRNKEKAQAALECGAFLAKALPPAERHHRFIMSFDEDEKTKRRIFGLRLSLGEIPSKFNWAKQTFSGMPGFCRLPPKPDDPATKPDTDCKKESFGAIHDGDMWFFGEKQGLEPFVKNLNSPVKELSTKVAAIQEASNATEGLAERQIETNVKTSEDFLKRLCFLGELRTAGSKPDFRKACFPEGGGVKRQIEGIDAKLRAAAFELSPDFEDAGEVRGNIVFVGRDGDASKEIEKDLTEIATDWKSHIDNNESKLIKLSKEDPVGQRQKEWAAVADTFVKALKNMTVKKDGRAVRLHFEAKLSEDDKREIEAANKDAAKIRTAITDIIEAMQSKKAVPSSALAKIVGQKWADYLLIPHGPLSDKDCRQIQANMDAAKLNDVGKLFAADKVFTDVSLKQQLVLLRTATCSSQKFPTDITDSQKNCLLAAKDASAMSRCTAPPEPPASEFGDPKKKSGS